MVPSRTPFNSELPSTSIGVPTTDTIFLPEQSFINGSQQRTNNSYLEGNSTTSEFSTMNDPPDDKTGTSGAAIAEQLHGAEHDGDNLLSEVTFTLGAAPKMSSDQSTNQDGNACDVQFTMCTRPRSPSTSSEEEDSEFLDSTFESESDSDDTDDFDDFEDSFDVINSDLELEASTHGGLIPSSGSDDSLDEMFSRKIKHETKVVHDDLNSEETTSGGKLDSYIKPEESIQTLLSDIAKKVQNSLENTENDKAKETTSYLNDPAEGSAGGANDSVHINVPTATDDLTSCLPSSSSTKPAHPTAGTAMFNDGIIVSDACISTSFRHATENLSAISHPKITERVQYNIVILQPQPEVIIKTENSVKVNIKLKLALAKEGALYSVAVPNREHVEVDLLVPTEDIDLAYLRELQGLPWNGEEQEQSTSKSYLDQVEPSTSFDYLPNELICHLFNFLPPDEISKCRHVCRVLRDVVTLHRSRLPKRTLIEAAIYPSQDGKSFDVLSKESDVKGDINRKVHHLKPSELCTFFRDFFFNTFILSLHLEDLPDVILDKVVEGVFEGVLGCQAVCWIGPPHERGYDRAEELIIQIIDRIRPAKIQIGDYRRQRLSPEFFRLDAIQWADNLQLFSCEQFENLDDSVMTKLRCRVFKAKDSKITIPGLKGLLTEWYFGRRNLNCLQLQMSHILTHRYKPSRLLEIAGQFTTQQLLGKKVGTLRNRLGHIVNISLDGCLFTMQRIA